MPAERLADPAQKDTFLAALGHDLRNPLHTLCAAVEVLEAFAPGSPQADEARRVIARQVAKLSALVDERLPLA